MTQRLVAEYPDAAALHEAIETELKNGGLLIRGAQPVLSDRTCLVEVRVAGVRVGEFSAQLGSVARFGATVIVEEPPADLIALAAKPPPPESPPAPIEEPGPRTAAERLAQLTVAQKISQAISGDRETRLALFRDHNKMLHAYVLKNPRLQLDEVLVAAKLTTLSPDALRAIAEHKEWGQNLTVCQAVVRNPKTPTPIALRLLPRLPQTDIRAIAKGGAKDQLVAAARKMLAG